MGKETKIAPFVMLGASNHYGERQEEDFYSTPLEGVSALYEMCEKHNIPIADNIIEPSVGNGRIANFFAGKNKNIICYDIVDRGYPGTILKDWLTVEERPEEPISIIANFPYKYILEHTIHSLNLLRDGEWLHSLAKIQFLEGKKRRMLFDEQPPRFVFVFSKRINCLKNDEEINGTSAICYCWISFLKGWKGLPQIDWI